MKGVVMAVNEELLARRQRAVVRGVSQATPIFAERALNSEIWDVEGKRYVDFAGGIAVLNTGHGHPHVVAAIRAQLDRFTHTCFQVLQYEPYVRLTERLNALAPIAGPAKSILLTTGAEAPPELMRGLRRICDINGIVLIADEVQTGARP